MSTMRWVGALTLTVMEPAPFVGTTAALATCAGTWSQFKIETGGTAPPVGQASRNPAVVWPGPVMVKLRDTAATPDGTPQIGGIT